MENRQEGQARKELDLNALGNVNGGIVVPAKPDEDDDHGNSNGSGGGATGGW